MRTLIDLLVLGGLAASSSGVYLVFGTGWALIFGGLGAAGLSLYAARQVNAWDRQDRAARTDRADRSITVA